MQGGQEEEEETVANKKRIRQLEIPSEEKLRFRSARKFRKVLFRVSAAVGARMDAERKASDTAPPVERILRKIVK